MAAENIITQLKRKNEVGFDTPFFIGSAAQLIKGVRGTTVNNIEENFLLGFDVIMTEEDLGDGIFRIIKEYRGDETTSDYYYVEIYDYRNASDRRRWLYGEGLYLPYDLNDNIYIEEDETLVGINNEAYSIDDDTFIVMNTEDPTVPTIEISTLYYKQGSGDVVATTKKTVSAIYVDPVDGKRKQKQVVQNLL